MKLLDTIKAKIKREAPRINREYNPRTGAVSLFGAVSETPLNIAAVFRCIEVLSNSVASLPLQYLTDRNGVFKEDTGSRLHYLLTVQPNESMSAFDFWAQVVRYMLLHGNAYIIPQYDSACMEISRLILCTPGTVTHDTLTDIYTVSDTTNEFSGAFSESEVIHIKNYTTDGKNGLSTLSFARSCLDIASAGNSETLSRFKNGGSVRGIVSNDTSVRGFGEYQDAELERTAADLDGRFRCGERIVSLPGQAQFNSISLSSTDMQFLETRKFTVTEICRFFNVPPHLVFDSTAENYKSVELSNIAFLNNSLNPILRKIETELHRKLVPAQLCCKRRFEFNRKGLLICDLNARAKYQAETIAAGLMTVNEWRREDNKPTVDGGDTLLISANLKQL